ncbi:MAG: hypothetical protein HUJ54_03330 [Erysipelotrichaceae bacterium]|nr:hypothetical protein [Erysipelotrichaceae bacterium]
MKRHPKGLSGWLTGLSAWTKRQFNRISKAFDKVILSRKASFIASGLFALAFAVSLNFNDLRSQFMGGNISVLNLTGIPITQLLDSENYEVTGMPDKADVSVEGDESDIQLVRAQNSVSVKADMRSLAEGENVVSLQVTGLPTGISARVIPQTVTVNIAKKSTRTFFVSEQAVWMVGTGQMESEFSIQSFSTKSVRIKATEKKLNQIRSVKAIIDTSGHDTAFSTDAPLVAYDADGKPVNCSISPKTVTVEVAYKGKSYQNSAN